MGCKKPIPTKNPTLYKTYYKIMHKDKTYSNKFCKDVYQLVGEDVPLLVHYYRGESSSEPVEEESFAPGPHGNTQIKEAAGPFQPTLPSVFTQLKEKPLLRILLSYFGGPTSQWN